MIMYSIIIFRGGTSNVGANETIKYYIELKLTSSSSSSMSSSTSSRLTSGVWRRSEDSGGGGGTLQSASESEAVLLTMGDSDSPGLTLGGDFGGSASAVDVGDGGSKFGDVAEDGVDIVPAK